MPAGVVSDVLLGVELDAELGVELDVELDAEFGVELDAVLDVVLDVELDAVLGVVVDVLACAFGASLGGSNGDQRLRALWTISIKRTITFSGESSNGSIINVFRASYASSESCSVFICMFSSV